MYMQILLHITVNINTCICSWGYESIELMAPQPTQLQPIFYVGEDVLRNLLVR